MNSRRSVLTSSEGRQHDVSECMDNCMFQIETALLDFQNQELAGPQSDKTSVIKRSVLPLLNRLKAD